MGDQKSIFVIESNDFVAGQLATAIAANGYGQHVKIVEDAFNVADSSVIKLSYPIRLGHVLDQISNCLVKIEQHNILHIGKAWLDMNLGLYHADEASEPIRLTEKEVALLVLLHKAQGESVSRQAILDEVWKYAIGVETHTLETHIYRLRQKIEDDPANPKTLQTNDSGYFLALKEV